MTDISLLFTFGPYTAERSFLRSGGGGGRGEGVGWQAGNSAFNFCSCLNITTNLFFMFKYYNSACNPCYCVDLVCTVFVIDVWISHSLIVHVYFTAVVFVPC